MLRNVVFLTNNDSHRFERVDLFSIFDDCYTRQLHSYLNDLSYNVVIRSYDLTIITSYSYTYIYIYKQRTDIITRYGQYMHLVCDEYKTYASGVNSDNNSCSIRIRSRGLRT